MSEAIETREYKGFTIKIDLDLTPVDPRTWSNIGIMACSHGRYELGDEQINTDYYESWEDVKAHLLDHNNIVEILPLYLYDHSQLHIKAGSFAGQLSQGHARWDSGKVGYIYATEESTKEIDKDRIKDILISEVKTYDHYVSGQVYRYVIEDYNGVQIDACSGFYGYEFEDNGLMDYATNRIDHEVNKRRKSRFEKLKTLIQEKVDLGKREQILHSYPIGA